MQPGLRTIPMLHSTDSTDREAPRKAASRTSERRPRFEALLARSYAEMRARRQTA
jgi:hypothetical protein